MKKTQLSFLQFNLGSTIPSYLLYFFFCRRESGISVYTERARISHEHEYRKAAVTGVIIKIVPHPNVLPMFTAVEIQALYHFALNYSYRCWSYHSVSNSPYAQTIDI